MFKYPTAATLIATAIIAGQPYHLPLFRLAVKGHKARVRDLMAASGDKSEAEIIGQLNRFSIGLDAACAAYDNLVSNPKICQVRDELTGRLTLIKSRYGIEPQLSVTSHEFTTGRNLGFMACEVSPYYTDNAPYSSDSHRITSETPFIDANGYTLAVSLLANNRGRKVFSAGDHYVISSRESYTVFKLMTDCIGHVSCESFTATLSGFKKACAACSKLNDDYIRPETLDRLK